MHFSNLKSVLLAVAAAQVVNAHTRFTNFYVDGVNQGDGTCVRMSNINDQATNPVHGITSNDMACGTFRSPPIALPHTPQIWDRRRTLVPCVWTTLTGCRCQRSEWRGSGLWCQRRVQGDL